MHKKIQRILVAIDFSESSFNALETAASIAKKSHAELFIIHVHDDIFEFIGVSALTVTSVANHADSILTALTSDIEKKHGIKPIVIEETGYATEIILRSAVHFKCDLIVIGSFGASGERIGYIGTTAYNIIKYAPCPVMLIPAGHQWVHFRRPIFPVRPVMTALRHYDTVKHLLAKNALLYILGLKVPGHDMDITEAEQLNNDIEKAVSSDNLTSRFEWIYGNSISRNVLLQAELRKADLIIVTPAIDIAAKNFYIGPNTHR